VKSPAEADAADFMTSAMLASAAAWSPNPAAAPLYFDLPMKDGQMRDDILSKWIANAPLAQIDQYIAALRRLRAIGFDAGDQDQPIASTLGTLDAILTSYGIPHSYAIYSGNHINHAADRITTEMLPFFTRHLSAGQPESPATRTGRPAVR
jgi:hypothetical protein